MTIIRWKMKPEMEQAFDNRFLNRNNAEAGAASIKLPRTNITKGADHFHIEMAAPGRNKEDFKIKIEENLLILSYEQKEASSSHDENLKFLKKEFETGSFTRSFTLPKNIDRERISAKYESGVLMVNLPFEEPVINRMNKTININ
jgi:HSP20 family protein